MEDKIIGLEFNFAGSTTSSLLTSKENFGSLTDCILASSPILSSNLVGFSQTFTVNNTFFSGVSTLDLSNFIGVSSGIIIEEHVYSTETFQLYNKINSVVSIVQTSSKFYMDSVDNYQSTGVIKTIPYVGNINDFYPAYLSKLRNETFLVMAAYDELFNAWIFKIPKIIFLLDMGLQKILEKDGWGNLRIHIVKQMNGKYRSYKYNYY